ncbi:multicopper oxidase family protein [Cohnella zeiphila]|uniref:Multicopper oxidase family protein n=1 Tax=Cohnella zeiphila TaxID=2761120 RepID=A0A7X0SHJ9_9BACL|nr:multicopper oxidase family protein [Cohnella zeiphila]MBB6730099.1 multicopper oxidase family protein [Cohnella zeiphila]
MILIAADLAFLLLLAVFWGIAGVRIGRAAGLGNQAGRAAYRGRGQLALQGCGFIAALGKIVTLALLGGRDSRFVQDTLPVHLVLLAIPLAAVVILTIPKLWRIVRSVQKELRSGAAEGRGGAIFDAKTVLPVQAAGWGAALDLIVTILFPEDSANAGGLAVILIAYAVIVGAQWAIWRRRSRPNDRSGSSPARRRSLRIVVAAIVVVVGISGWFTLSSQASKLPDRMNMMSGRMDYGGGPEAEMTSVGGHGEMPGMMNDSSSSSGFVRTVSVTDLTGPRTGEPDERFTLTAEKKQVKLRSGEVIDAWTFNGQLPGPELRVKQGDLVEVTLVNKDIDEGVTLHWHGLDVPNAEDGVAGLTQDAVMPGQTFTYRFVAEQAGSYWYHSHQQSSEQVQKGLFGPLIVEPEAGRPFGEQDITVMDPTYVTLDGSETNWLNPIDRRKIEPGTPVRLRLYNTGNWPKNFSVSGAKFKVDAIDGTEVNDPGELENVRLELAAGGRYDVTFTMPSAPVYVATDPASGLLLSPNGEGDIPKIADVSAFDPLSYGSPASTPFGPNTKFNREFTMVFDNKLGFYDGKFERLFTINGKVFPDTPMLMVKEGDLVKTTFVNRSLVPHPMHLHGHHMLVLSRNGKPSAGSPWWTDTLNVALGDSYEVAFAADNPGLWMDHCHNLDHAAIGMTLHLAYEGVTSPFEVGHQTQNRPE